METITNTIDNALFGYNPAEFMPIRVDGEVANWDAFVVYKAQRAARNVGHLLSTVVEHIQAQ
jgi:hypothetical protein